MDFLSFTIWFMLSWATLHFIFYLLATNNNKKLPPSPRPLPIVGNLFQLGSSPHKSLAEMASLHGPIMCLQLGRMRTIVISSASMAKQALHQNDAFVCNRTIPDCLTPLQHHQLSLLFMPIGERWKSFRKICNSHVLSKTRLDGSRFLRRKKLEDLVSYVKVCSEVGEAVEIGQVAFNTTLNLLSNTFFSMDIADPSSRVSVEFKDVFWQIMSETAKANLSDFFPMLRCVDLQGIRRRMGGNMEKMIVLFESMLSKRLVEKQGCFDVENDALDALLAINNENSEDLELSHIPHLLLELFVAGTDTTSSTTEWAMTELLCNPSKMNKAREELERVIGKGILVKEEDLPNLPYLQAVIVETFRKDGPVSLIGRRADSDFQLGGFTVPKDSQIIINLWAIGKDQVTWNHPNSFEPERFMGSKVDHVKGRDSELIPFGGGRRVCPGMPLAMRMVPLMLGSLVNCFDWKLESGVDPKTMNMDAKFGLALGKAQPLRAIPTKI